MKKSLVILAMALSSTAMAHTELTHCAIQAPIPGKQMTGAFLHIVNHGKPVNIQSVTVPSITNKVELHTMSMKDNVMTMEPMTDFNVPSEGRVLRKGGDHIMLMDIPADKLPKAGEKHTITFSFDDGSSSSCDALVKTPEEIIKESKAMHGHHGNANDMQHHHNTH